jgi:ACT domain-containing protein
VRRRTSERSSPGGGDTDAVVDDHTHTHADADPGAAPGARVPRRTGRGPVGGGRVSDAADGETDADADADTGDGPAETDGGDRPTPHTIRLELDDRPGELLNALRPIADNGGNLLSIFHERGNLTPRGRIPVEVDLECPPARFAGIVDALREAGVNVVRAGAEEYGEELTVLLVGSLVDADLSDTLHRIEASPAASLTDLSLSASAEAADAASARLRLATPPDGTDEALAAVREVAEAKELHVVEPLTEGSA